MRWKFFFLLNYRQPWGRCTCSSVLRDISFSVAATSSLVWFLLHGTRWLLDLQALHQLSNQQEGGIAEKNPCLFFPSPGTPPKCCTGTTYRMCTGSPQPKFSHMTIASCKGSWEIVFILKSWILFLKEKARPDIRGQLVILAVVSQSLDSFLPQFFFLFMQR